jgi:ATP-dependent DNA helicase RecQ
MSSSERPYFHHSFKELKKLSDNNKKDRNILEEVINELSYRQSKQAITLKEELSTKKQKTPQQKAPKRRASNDPRVANQEKQNKNIANTQLKEKMERTCNKCGKPMQLRIARRGRNAGNYFLGCTGYPTCKNALDVDQNDITPEEQHEVSNRQTGRNQKSADEIIQQLGMRELSRDTNQHQHPRVLKVKAHNSTSILDLFDSRGALNGHLSSKPTRNWGIEYRRPSGTILSDKRRLLVSLYEKHLQRGKQILLDPEIESFILLNNKELSTIFSNTNFDTFNPDTGIFDSDQEKQFWKMVEAKSPNISATLCPQVYLESLIPEQSNTNQRIDFLCDTEQGYKVIEIDGEQHLDSKQKSLDQERDKILSEAGFNTLRIPAKDVAAEPEYLQLKKEYPITSPEHIAHAISVVFSRAVKCGALKLDSKQWNISIQTTKVDALLDTFFKEAISGSIRHLKNLADLIENGEDFPESIRLDIGDNNFSIIGNPAEDCEQSSDIFIHFDEIPNQELSVGHFYYRELPTSFNLRIDVIDAIPISYDPDREACKYFLKYFFRFDDFREGQWEGIKRTLSGKDSIVLMPTGHGKSIIYQLASLLKPGTALIVDPIISLIDDQIDNLENFGITRIIGISSQIEEERRKKIIDEFALGQYFLTFVAPERLQMQDFRNALRSLTTFSPISVVAIDEAHCVSEWGHNFRTSYLNLGRNCRLFCKSKGIIPPLLGLTGTASRSVVRDVKRELDILDFDAVITPESFNRQELKFRLEICSSNEKSLKLKGILESIASNFGMPSNDFFRANGKETCSGLIFCPHVNGKFGVVDVARRINDELKISSSFYSGSEPKGANKDTWNHIKRGTANDFKKNNTPLMVATSAFGMGIDKPNIRYCIHYGIPSSIESFYQEAGRAGRDRKDALCYIIASNDDPKRTTRILSDTSNIETVEKTVKETGYIESDDVLRSLFFHTKAFTGIEDELSNINAVLDLIETSKENKDISVDANKRLRAYEKAIHRLVIIGYVKDYTIDYKSKRIDIKIDNPNTENIKRTLLRYVENYQRSRAKALEDKLPKYENLSRTFLIEILHVLLKFIYETVELGRRRALLEMCQLTSEGATDETIRTRILAYLEKSEFDDQLDEIVDDIETQDLVSLILEDVVSAKHAQSLRGQVVKQLHAYPDHPSLLLLRATVECMCGEGDQDMVVESLENWANSATSNYSLSLDALADSYNHAMTIITSSMPIAAAKATKTIMYGCNDSAFIRHVLQHAKTPVERTYALTALLRMSAQKFELTANIIQEKSQ